MPTPRRMRATRAAAAAPDRAHEGGARSKWTGPSDGSGGCVMRRKWAGLAIAAALALVATTARPAPPASPAHPLTGADDCIVCHAAGAAQPRVPGEPPHFDGKGLTASPHAGVACVDCHRALAKAESLHGQAAARGETLAPTCKSCHGTHDILRPSDPLAATNTINVPLLCNRCHREGSAVQRYYHIPQDSILQNYTESIHGEGLYKKGLLTTAVCTSCHTAHHQLPHTDARSSSARRNVAATCEKCHVRIEAVHAKVVRGEIG